MCERIIPAILEGGAGISRTGAATYFSAFSVNLRTVTAPLVVVFSCSVVSDSLVTPWTIACQAPLSMGFPRQEYWSGLPFPPPGNLPNPGIEPTSPALAGGFFTTSATREAPFQSEGILKLCWLSAL